MLILFNTLLNRLFAIVKMMMMELNKVHVLLLSCKYQNFISIIPNDDSKIFVKLKNLSRFTYLFNFF
jgi:hypothetical protein